MGLRKIEMFEVAGILTEIIVPHLMIATNTTKITNQSNHRTREETLSIPVYIYYYSGLFPTIIP